MKTIIECRSCSSTNLDKFLDLGSQYVSDFRDDLSKPNKYPLQVVICADCKLVQLRHTTPSQEMYHENYGFKSGISDSIKADLKEIVEEGLTYHHEGAWLDIASNDGSLLSNVPTNIYRVGVDPITKYCKEAEQYADKIVNDFFGGQKFITKFDVITSISCFYDMDTPNQFVSDVTKVLAMRGVWIIQQNYLLPTMELGAIDNICHEHLEYYTLLSLEPLLARHGLEVIDISTSMVNGGSIRTVVAHKGTRPVQDSVEKQRTIEADANLHDTVPYFTFAKNAHTNIERLKLLVMGIKSEGKSVAILAASTRGATIWQAAEFTADDIDYAVERNSEKVGKYFSAIGIPIVSEEQFRQDQPDYAIIGPWFFDDEIVKRESGYLKNGGILITPLPEVKLIENS